MSYYHINGRHSATGEYDSICFPFSNFHSTIKLIPKQKLIGPCQIMNNYCPIISITGIFNMCLGKFKPVSCLFSFFILIFLFFLPLFPPFHIFCPIFLSLFILVPIITILISIFLFLSLFKN